MVYVVVRCRESLFAGFTGWHRTRRPNLHAEPPRWHPERCTSVSCKPLWDHRQLLWTEQCTSHLVQEGRQRPDQRQVPQTQPWPLLLLLFGRRWQPLLPPHRPCRWLHGCLQHRDLWPEDPWEYVQMGICNSDHRANTRWISRQRNPNDQGFQWPLQLCGDPDQVHQGHGLWKSAICPHERRRQVERQRDGRIQVSCWKSSVVEWPNKARFSSRSFAGSQRFQYRDQRLA